MRPAPRLFCALALFALGLTAGGCLLPELSLAGKLCDDEKGCVQGVCVEGVCVGEVPCSSAATCGDGDSCVNGACLKACSEDDLCAAGLQCASGVCVAIPPTDGGDVGDGGPRDVDSEDDAGAIVDGGLDGGASDAGSLDGGTADAADGGLEEPLDCQVLDPLGADLDGDCRPDLVVGAPALPVPDGADAGPGHPVPIVQVFSGEEGGNFALSFQLVNGQARGSLGASISIDPAPYDASGRRAFVVGEPQDHAGGSGVVYWLYPAGSSYASVRIDGADNDALAGTAVAFGQGATSSALLVGLPGLVDTDTTGALIAVYPVAGGLADTLALLPGDLATGATGGPLGAALAPLHDVDGDGRRDVGISARGLSLSGVPLGAFALSLAADPPQVVGSWYPPSDVESFAASLASIDDLDGDGQPEVAFGAPNDDVAGAVYLAPSSTPGSYVRLLPGAGLSLDAAFGAAVTAVGDVDGDGRGDLVVGAPLHKSAGDPKDGCALLEHARSGYAGDCAGAIALVLGADVAAAMVSFDDVDARCVSKGASGQRLGTAVRGIGRRVDGAPLRVAAGAPNLPEASGLVRVFTLQASGDACSLVPGPFFGRAPSPLIGDQFGASIGR